MKVFKFGGASVKSSEAVKNLHSIVKMEDSPVIIIISAMDKTTNWLEKLHANAYTQQEYAEDFEKVKSFHLDIINELFNHQNFPGIHELFENLQQDLKECHRYSKSFTYSQIVSYGEILSTTIISEYLNANNETNTWIDARKCIQTDNTWKEGIVNWDFTKTFVRQFMNPALNNGHVITQGFIGAGPDGHTTTLGREGSDYSAAIIASCMGATSVTVWKDVEGILNADPKRFSTTRKFDSLSYRETTEMAYYGATVIHPKTLKPLAERNIELNVKSFIDPSLAGTKISEESGDQKIPSYIVKTNQVLITFSNKDLSFTDEQSLGEVLHFFSANRIQVNMMQSSATSFSFCINHDLDKIEQILEKLSDRYRIHYNEKLELLTVKNYNEDWEKESNIGTITLFLKQFTRNNLRVLYRRNLNN